MSIWKRKSITQLLAEASDSEKGLKRTLTAWSLVALGIGAIIGAGLFVRTATAAAQNAGPSVVRAYDLGITQIDTLRGEVFNVGGGPQKTLSIWTEFDPLLADLAGHEGRVNPRRLASGRPACFYCRHS